MNITPMCAFYGFWIFLLGLSLGSFFKLTIDRYGTNESFVFKPSYCPYCKKNLFWWQNIPVISYIILGGKCFFCKNKIDINCLYAEIITASAATIIFTSDCIRQLSISKTLFLLFFFMILLWLSMFDLKHRVVPHKITYTAIVLIIISNFFYGKNMRISFFDLGIAFLFMDLLYFLTTLLKKFKIETNYISIPVFIWSTGCLFEIKSYFLIIAIFIYFILLKANIPERLINFVWLAALLVLSFSVFKFVFIGANFNDLIALFGGIGIIYFICEILFYFVLMTVKPSDSVKTKEKSEAKITIGGGDITVFALISVFSGFKLAFLTLFIASLLATISHLILRVSRKYVNLPKEKISGYIPLVPFLTLASFIIITFNVQ